MKKQEKERDTLPLTCCLPFTCPSSQRQHVTRAPPWPGSPKAEDRLLFGITLGHPGVGGEGAEADC